MLHAGDTFDRYTIEGLLGEGGMGRVYRAYDPRLHRRVALKVLSAPGPSGDPSVVPSAVPTNPSEGAARMLREARAAAALDHPNAVSIFDVGEVDSVPFIAMELIEGKSLRILIGLPNIAWDRRLRWLVDVARALAAAHKRGLVHRDIKPENVMVREDGVVKVLDFGIARRPDAPVDPTAITQQLGLEALTEKGIVIGTPRYMSPEQMRGDALDGRSDQFAWGVLAYELLTGKSPWRRTDDALAAVAELLTREPAPMDVEALPELVERTVLRALAKAREGRFPTMEDVVRVLEPLASGSVGDLAVTSQQDTAQLPNFSDTEMVTSSPTPPPKPAASERVKPGAARGRSKLPLIAVVALAIAAAGVFAWKRPKHLALTADAGPPIAPKPTALTDLPDPPTNREALAAYRSALQAYRDGVGGMDIRFRRAIELDPNLAAAHLRLAEITFQASPTDARASFDRASVLRGSLSEHDQTLLWALEPWLTGQPSDYMERRKRLDAAVQKFPLDADLWYHVGAPSSDRFMAEDISALEKAVQLDPQFARAWWQLGQSYAYRKDLVSARQALDKCLAISHAATSCLWNRICIDELQGRCESVETDAKHWTTVDAKDPLGRLALASALVANGKSREASIEALRQREAVESDEERPKVTAYDAILLALLRGDFDGALTSGRALEKLVANAPNETEHLPAAHAILDAYLESGQTAEAARYAEQYLKRRDAWLPEPFAEDFAIANDLTPSLLRALRAAGKIDAAQLEARRDAWAAAWNARVVMPARGYVWMHGWASLAETPDEAKRALAALAGTAIPGYTPKSLGYAAIGRTYLLAGRLDEALPLLEQAAASCMALELPVQHTRANLWLGRAREAKGNAAGACKAYAVVLERWGHATPRSVSADEARARSRALGCK